MTGMVKEAWDFIQNEWGKSMDMRRLHVQEALNQTEYSEGSDIQDHIKLLRTHKAAINNLSTQVMLDETLRGITSKWLPVIPSLYSMTTSTDIISILIAHGMILGKGTTSTRSSNTVLAARTTDGCTNPNCQAKKQSTHTISNCYWPGGGKEGQFPPNFGQRAKANITISNTTNTSTTPATMTTNSSDQNNHFVFLAQTLSNPGISIPGQSSILIDDPIEYTHLALISKGFQSYRKGGIPTFLDSRASDTVFVLKEVFKEYKVIDLQVGDSAKAKDGSFDIIGEGNVIQQYLIDGKEHKVTYTRALHTPTLNANLISISALNKAGLITTFGNGSGITRKMDGTVVLMGRNVNGMYLLETIEEKIHLHISLKSSSHTTSLELWHR